MAEVDGRDNSLYLKAYGEWAGRPNGSAPDYDLCCFEVFPSERGAMHHQCRNKRGYGPDGAYCKTHDPARVAEKRAAQKAAYDQKVNESRYRWYGKTFFETLQKIADGHNDARGLAQEVIAEFKKGER